MAKKLTGKVSTYGGPNDSGDNNRPALAGATNRAPGIAVYNQHTLGGYWLVTIDGTTKVIQQTDIGPAPWTGRKIDINPPAAKRLGGVTTDATGKAVYLGKDRARAIAKASALKGTSTPKAKTPKTAAPVTATTTDDTGRRALLASYLAVRNQPDALLSLAQSL